MTLSIDCNLKAIVYVVPGPINNFQIPTSVQVKYAKDYCLIKRLPFSLPVSEDLTATNRFAVFDRLITSQGQLNIVAFSHIQLCTGHVNRSIQSLCATGRLNPSILFHFTYNSTILALNQLQEEVSMVLRYQSISRSSAEA
jgi:sporadic carbohydrate cluster protein (TIGR04323 family)